MQEGKSNYPEKSYLCAMADLAINTNKHLQGADAIKERVAKSLVASFSLEGIKLSFEEAVRIVNEQYLKLQRRTK